MEQLTKNQAVATSHFFLMIRRPPKSPLLPSPTLYRSRRTIGRPAIPAHGMIPPGLLGYSAAGPASGPVPGVDRKSTRLNSSHGYISYAVFCLKKKKIKD